MKDCRAFLRTFYAVSAIVNARDAYTGGHLWRVSQFSYLVARKLGMDEAEAQTIALAGFLHDIGKVGAPDHILNKRGALSDDEYMLIKTHTSLGVDLLAGHALAGAVVDGIACHHERPDGLGYPKGLRAPDIPVSALIVGATDALDAITSTRSYRAKETLPHALDAIADRLGHQFDRDVGKCLIALGREGALSSIIGQKQPKMPLVNCVSCGEIVIAAFSRPSFDAGALCSSCR